MKVLLGLVACLVVAVSCATVQENVDARTLLAKCQFEVAGVTVDAVDLNSSFVPVSADLTVSLTVRNPNGKPVALDHLALRVKAKGRDLLEAEHRRFVQVDPGKAATEPLALKVPFSGVLAFTGDRPQTLEAHADVWLTILMAGKAWETPLMVPVDFQIPIPWDQIDSAVAQKAKELKGKGEEAVKNVLKLGFP